MNTSELKSTWKKHYEFVPEQLQKMTEINGVISAFNANIDAVIKISGKEIQDYISKFELKESFLFSKEKVINKPNDVFRGILHCFIKGIAEEHIISDKTVFDDITKLFSADKLQMGGQGGIVANVAAICGVNNVFVHSASLPEMQANLFLDLPNLLSIDENGQVKQANKIHRKNDVPLIHYIFEFDKNDSITIADKTYTCSKSNRFIATYDPLNFKLHIDSNFVNRLSENNIQYEYIILSGYQILQEVLPDGSFGKDKIDASMITVKN